jgi:hypothetical protein
MVNDCTILQKTPEADLLYGFDASDWLESGVTITGNTWTVPSGITKEDEDFNTTTVQIQLSGGTLGVCYAVKAEFDLSNGDKDSRILHIKIVEKCS